MPAGFQYFRSDFTPSPVDVIHMDLSFDISDDETRVLTCSLFKTKDHSIKNLRLNAKSLAVHSLLCHGRPSEFIEEGDAILITFADEIPPQTEFIITSETVCHPSRTLLEGLYYDETPAGAPPTQITQCQQWGFQRLLPCIDEMTAKCTYRTTIIADKHYTHLISNGDIAVKRHRFSPERDSITYENMKTPMAPYLFFLGVGTYASLSRRFEYPSGSSFSLELLYPPGSDPVQAERALDILEDGILWVYLFTGPHCYDQVEIRHEIYRLYKKRSELRSRGAEQLDLAQLTEQMKQLDQKIVCGYAYTGSVYREIGMQNSDFGGMENVGNTTISTNRLMPFSGMTDSGFEYLLRVKVHEYYHNLNGSEVTGETPFEIWLNEAVTVHVEQQYHAFHFGEDYSRLQTIISLLDPVNGTFARDTGAAAMPIEPDGFNDPNDLITAVTYIKAPEFVRMVESILGKEPFGWALSLYHRKFAHSNASRDDWIECMEAVGGIDLKGMAEGWLKRSGFPTVKVTTVYDEKDRLCTLQLRQSGGETPWTFPFHGALMRGDGEVIEDFYHLVTGTVSTLQIEDVDKPDYYSLNRGISFYGILDYAPDEEELYLQARTDPDIGARFVAYQKLVSQEMVRLMEDPDQKPSPAFLSLYIDLLSDAGLMEGAGAQFLTIFEDAGDSALAHKYMALYEARRRLEAGIASEEAPILTSIYRAYQLTDHRWQSIERMADTIKNRQVKNLCLRLLSRLDTPAVHDMIREAFRDGETATDRLSAYSLLIASSASDRMEIFSDMMERARVDLVAWEQFLLATAGSDADDLITLLRTIESSGYLRIDQANDQRALYGRFARNRKYSLETREGRT
ncbi:M1 family metallopeptidase, partial [Methanocalculus sp.]|uniref:M1 family metallopeptidase n=1 Tax=Methanocalculus sp. TaxID=2004547 RepID=UPI00271C0C57